MRLLRACFGAIGLFLLSVAEGFATLAGGETCPQCKQGVMMSMSYSCDGDIAIGDAILHCTRCDFTQASPGPLDCERRQ